MIPDTPTKAALSTKDQLTLKQTSDSTMTPTEKGNFTSAIQKDRTYLFDKPPTPPTQEFIQPKLVISPISEPLNSPQRIKRRQKVSERSRTPDLLQTPSIQNEPEKSNLYLTSEIAENTKKISDTPWFDKILDIIIGREDDSQQKYALVCSNCHTHNGLTSAESYYRMSTSVCYHRV